MSILPNNQNLTTVNAIDKGIYAVDNRLILKMIISAQSRQAYLKLNSKRAEEIRFKMKTVIKHFNESYCELIGTEIRITNLNIIADAMQAKQRDLETLYSRAIDEIQSSIC